MFILRSSSKIEHALHPAPELYLMIFFLQPISFLPYDAEEAGERLEVAPPEEDVVLVPLELPSLARGEPTMGLTSCC